MSLRVVAHITALPDKIEEAKAVLIGLIAPTRQESACITYELLQNNADPAQFTLVEEWESDAALDAHLKTPHLEAALVKMPALVAAPPDIRRYSLVA
jgi:quinol monooxygenase YgiN